MTLTFYPTVSRGELGKYANIPRLLLPASSWARDEVALPAYEEKIKSALLQPKQMMLEGVS